MIKALAAMLILTLAPMSAVADDTSAYNGFWWNEQRDGIFELIVTDNKIEGLTRWAAEPSRDVNNPDPKLNGRPLKDIIFLWGFQYDQKKNRWKDGKVYDPNNGKTYDAKMSLENDNQTIKMRGYIGISLFGRTAEFERVTANEIPPELKK
jgi:uncharacterized protein (DUF2147 family)